MENNSTSPTSAGSSPSPTPSTPGATPHTPPSTPTPAPASDDPATASSSSSTGNSSTPVSFSVNNIGRKADPKYFVKIHGPSKLKTFWHDFTSLPIFRGRNKIFFFSGLGLFIALLIAVPVTLHVIHQSNPDNVSEETWQEIYNNDIGEIYNEFNSSNPSDAFINSADQFEKLIANTKNPSHLADLRMSYAVFLSSNNDPESAFAQLNEIDEESLSIEQKSQLYATYGTLYSAVGEAENAEYYTARSIELALEVSVEPEDGTFESDEEEGGNNAE